MRRSSHRMPSYHETAVGERLIYWINRHFFPVSSHALEFDNTIDKGKKGVISAATYIVAGVNRGAVLAVNYVAGLNRFTAVFLATQSLAG